MLQYVPDNKKIICVILHRDSSQEQRKVTFLSFNLISWVSTLQFVIVPIELFDAPMSIPFPIQFKNRFIGCVGDLKTIYIIDRFRPQLLKVIPTSNYKKLTCSLGCLMFHSIWLKVLSRHKGMQSRKSIFSTTFFLNSEFQISLKVFFLKSPMQYLWYPLV